MKKVILSLAFYYVFPHLLFCQQTKFDSLETVLKTSKEDSNKVNTLNAITKIYIQVPPLHYRKALPVAEEAKQLSEKLSYKKGLAITCENLGAIYGYFGMYDRGLENYLHESEIYESLNDSSLIIRAHMKLSGFYGSLGNFKKDLQEAIFVEKWVEHKGNKQAIAEAYCYEGSAFIGICKNAIKERDTGTANFNYSEAIECAIKSLQLVTEIKDSADMGFYYYFLGSIYDKSNLITDRDPVTELNIIKTNYNNLALKNDWNALKIDEKLNESQKVLEPYTNLALFYRHQGDLLKESGSSFSEANYKKSLDYYLKILTVIKKLGYKHGIAYFSKEVGVAYLKLNNFISAQKFISIGANGFQEIGFREGAKECYQLLSEVDFKRADYKDAYKDYRKFSIIKDSLQNDANEKQLNVINVRFETQQKTDSIAAEQKLITLKNKSIERQHFYLIGLAVLILLISPLFAFTLFQSKKLGRQYNNIQQLQAELTHRTGNFFSSIKSMLTTAKFKSSDKETIASVEERVNTISHLFKTLYSSPKDPQINFSELLASICNDLEQSFGQQNKIKVYTRSDITASKDEAIPLAFIITELVTNCYKHAFNNKENGEIHINISEDNRTRTLDVWDNGNGMIEKEFIKTNTQGMYIIKSYCKALNGKFNYWNDTGFHFKLKF
ncbi:MAG: sensor histidine kinase [Ginsengibacter sp.]